MLLNVPLVTAVYFSFFFGFIYTQIEIIPDRGGVYDFNTKNLKAAKYFVKRYGRKSPYYMNLEAETKCEMNNNVTVEMILFEKLGNEYKRSFVEIKWRLCDLINKDELIGPSIRATGIKCPVSKGVYRLMNMTVMKLNFPYKFPFEYARADLIFYQTETKDVIASGYLYFHQKQRNLRKSSKQ